MSTQVALFDYFIKNKVNLSEDKRKIMKIKEKQQEELKKPIICSSLKFNQRQKMNGIDLLSKIDNDVAKAIFFDPQYRGILDKQKYGNEGLLRDKRRCNLEQMSEELITEFINQINRVLMPSAYLFLWIDKFHLCEGVSSWFSDTALQMVDLMIWEKPNIGMGYRTRNKCEFLLILQKRPIKAKATWTIHNIPNVWKERVITKIHPHTKPLEMQKILINATTNEEDIVIDPAMGSGSVLQSCLETNRIFIGCDING
jgi:site-specific DNA-methyltransferase (adenine-specific)